MPSLMTVHLNAAAKLVSLALLLAVLTITSTQTWAELPNDDEEDFKEAAYVLPAPPPSPLTTDKSLIKQRLFTYQTILRNNSEYQIDLNSLEVGEDDVIRLTLIQTSATGLRNVTYEGLRCRTYERKLYAYLRTDGQWQAFKNAKWQAVGNYAASQHIAYLMTNYFCANTSPRGSSESLKLRLYDGGEKGIR